MNEIVQLDKKVKNSSKKKWIMLGILGIVMICLVCGGIFYGIKAILDSGITRGPDNLFGDQHLKTSVALIELHKVRYGKYPKELSDIKYVGQWDSIALNSVYYVASKDQMHYYVEVVRGWANKPKDLEVADDFWQGTGYDPILKILKNKEISKSNGVEN